MSGHWVVGSHQSPASCIQSFSWQSSVSGINHAAALQHPPSAKAPKSGGGQHSAVFQLAVVSIRNQPRRGVAASPVRQSSQERRRAALSSLSVGSRQYPESTTPRRCSIPRPPKLPRAAAGSTQQSFSWQSSVSSINHAAEWQHPPSAKAPKSGGGQHSAVFQLAVVSIQHQPRRGVAASSVRQSSQERRRAALSSLSVGSRQYPASTTPRSGSILRPPKLPRAAAGSTQQSFSWQSSVSSINHAAEWQHPPSAKAPKSGGGQPPAQSHPSSPSSNFHFAPYSSTRILS